MRQLYPKFKNHLFPITLIFLLLFTFALFHPSMPSSLAGGVHSPTLNQLLETSIENESIDTQDFWKAREFHSRGHFQYALEGVQTYNISGVKEITGTDFPDPFLTYNSSHWQSVDYLIPTFMEQDSGIPFEAGCAEVLLKTDNDLICMIDDKILRIAFKRSLAQMKNTVGFIDYNGRDKDIIKDKYWFSISHITYE